MNIGTKLKELRIENNLTQKELAEKISSTSKNIWAYENQIAIPPLDVLIKLADAFNCSIDYLANRSDDFGIVNIYPQTDKLDSLTADEQKLVDFIRKNPPRNATDWISMYAELPLYMQESILAELRGMYLGFKASKANKPTGNKK